MAQDALTRPSAALGVQTEPAENFFDPAHSARLMARYAPASPEIASARMLADQADKARQMDMHEAQFKHDQAVWGKQEKDMEHQKLIEEGSFLQTFAQLKPVIPLMKNDGTPELDENGNPVMQINPAYKPTVAKMISETKGLPENKAFQAMHASNDAEYNTVQAHQFRQQAMEQSQLKVHRSYEQRAVDAAILNGASPEEILAIPIGPNGLRDPMAIAALRGHKRKDWREDKEQESERKVLRREHRLRIENIAKNDLGLVGMSASELENKFKERQQHAKDARWVNSQGQPVSPDDALESTEEQFVDYATAPYHKYTPLSKPKWGQDNSPIDIPRDPPSTEPADVALWKEANREWGRQRRSASNYYRVYHALRATKRYEDDIKELRGEKPTPPAAVTPDTAPEVSGTIPTPKSKEERDKLPSGTKYIGPDGKTYQKQ